MLGGMLRFASLVGAMALVATAWGAPAPRGRVVRVERPRGNPNIIPILCELKPDGSGMCVGTSPTIGDTILVVDENKTVAEVRVTKSSPLNPKCDTLWQITGEVLRGDMTQARANRAIGLIDRGADPRTARRMEESRLTSPSTNPDVHVGLGIDRDGDGNADILVTQYACDSNGQPTGSSGAVDYCIDIWSKRDNVMKRAWTTKLQACR